MERNIIEYLPLYVQEYAEIKAIMNSEQVDMEQMWNSADDMLNDQFVVDATENGVKRMETILNIKPKATFTLDERKFNILAKFNEQLPYTIETLKSALTSLCGSDGYALKLDSDRYTLLVKLSLYNEHNIEAVKNLLEKMIPANLVTSVMLFNTHYTLSPYTHEQLAAFTHKGLREEVL